MTEQADPTVFQSLLCTPIVRVESPYRLRIDAPHQPSVVQGTATGDAAEARIVFIDGFPGEAFRDLAGFERIWLIFAFHRSQGWKTEVRPPRSGGKRSVLATRSPHRPNAIGLTVVELLARDGPRLRVRGIDMLEGTPILDIKPYLSSIPLEKLRRGWLAEAETRSGD